MTHRRFTTRALPLLALWFAVGAEACGGENEAGENRTPLQQWNDPGSTCLFPPGGGDVRFDAKAFFIDKDFSMWPDAQLVADEALTFRVYAQKPCSLDVTIECEVKLVPPADASADGTLGTLVVTSRMDGYDDGSTACPRDVVMVEADCDTPPLPEGFYNITYGEFAGAVSIPSTGQLTCVTDPGDFIVD